MRVCVLGRGGALGHVVVERLAERGVDVVGLDSSDLGEDPAAAIPDVDALVNCVAYIAPDPDPERARAVNAALPHALASVVPRLVHVSTDGVFSGRGGPYVEEDPPDADDVYGRTKAAGEPASAMVLRCSHVGPELARHRHLLARVAQAVTPFPGFVDHLWNGLTTLTLADAIASILVEDRYAPGVHHVFGEDLSKHDVAKELARAFRPDLEVVPARAPEPRDRRLRTTGDLVAALRVPPFPAQVDALAGWMRHERRRARYARYLR